MSEADHCPGNAVLCDSAMTRKARQHNATIVIVSKLALPIGEAFAICRIFMMLTNHQATYR